MSTVEAHSRVLYNFTGCVCVCLRRQTNGYILLSLVPHSPELPGTQFIYSFSLFLYIPTINSQFLKKKKAARKPGRSSSAKANEWLNEWIKMRYQMSTSPSQHWQRKSTVQREREKEPDRTAKICTTHTSAAFSNLNFTTTIKASQALLCD